MHHDVESAVALSSRASFETTRTSLGRERLSIRVATTVSRGIAYVFIAAGLVEALVGGNVVGGIWLAFIGWFLHNSASASAQQAVMDQVLQGVDVADVMDAAPANIAPTIPVQSLVFDHLLDQGHRAVAIQSPDRARLGLVTLTDLRHLPQEAWGTTPVSRIMMSAEQLRTVAPTEDLRTAIRLLAATGFHQLPVVDGTHLAGLLNRDHVLQYLQARRFPSRQDPSGRAADQQSRVRPPRQLVG
jgi:CBS domain-containing protein